MGRLREGPAVARAYGDLRQVNSEQVTYVDISPKQTIGVSAALIPFFRARRLLLNSLVDSDRLRRSR
ncbi:MAG: hypothetical protein AAB298_04675, partial [Pseudomonadota bacterium]